MDDTLPELVQEVGAYAAFLNSSLEGHPFVDHLLPIDTHSLELFEKVEDGLLFLAFLSTVERAKNYIGNSPVNLALRTDRMMNMFQKLENNRLVIDCCEEIGLSIVNIRPVDLLNGPVHATLVLGLTKQLMKCKRIDQVARAVSDVDHEALQNLRERNSRRVSLRTSSVMLLRFVNDILHEAGESEEVVNFDDSFIDGRALAILLNHLDEDLLALEALDQTSEMNRISHVLESARRYGAESWARPEDILEGNSTVIFDLVGAIAEAYGRRCTKESVAEQSIEENEAEPEIEAEPENVLPCKLVEEKVKAPSGMDKHVVKRSIPEEGIHAIRRIMTCLFCNGCNAQK